MGVVRPISSWRLSLHQCGALGIAARARFTHCDNGNVGVVLGLGVAHCLDVGDEVADDVFVVGFCIKCIISNRKKYLIISNRFNCIT